MRFFIKRNKSLTRRVLLAGALAVSASAVVPVSAQQKPGDNALTARRVFETLQDPSLEVLKPTTRLDMLDYWDVDSVYKAKNVLDGVSWLENVAPDYLKVHVSPVSDLEIKLLPSKKGDVVMTIYTVGGDGQARDSYVSFYDSSLRPLDRGLYLKEAPLRNFFSIPKGSEVTVKEIETIVPFATVEYSARPGDTAIEARLTVADFLGQEDYERISPLLRDKVEMMWKDGYK